MTDRRADDLEARIDELEATLTALREELRSGEHPDREPRAPRPQEILQFTDEYAIPAAIAAMEANIKALEFLQGGIRATDAGQSTEPSGRSARDRAGGAGRATLDRLDRALADLESAVEGSGLPANAEARELLSEARRLNDQVRNRAAGAERGAGEDAVRIDVESELASIREEVSDDDREDADDDA